MKISHCVAFHARAFELNDSGEIGHATFLRYFEEAAVQASAAAGYGLAVYDALGAAWVMRDVDVEFLGSVRYGEEVQVRTWVSDIARIRSHREFEARRGGNAALLARARTECIFIDVNSLMPKRLPVDLVSSFETNGILALEPIAWDESGGEQVAQHASTRKVEGYEIDQMRHVNNVVYMNWMEQEIHDACQALKVGPEYERVSRHYIQYLQAAQRDDEIRIDSQLVQLGGVAKWSHHIERGDGLIAKGYSLVKHS